MALPLFFGRELHVGVSEEVAQVGVAIVRSQEFSALKLYLCQWEYGGMEVHIAVTTATGNGSVVFALTM